MAVDLVAADPTALFRIRDGVYAPDLLIAAVVEFDLFSWLTQRGPVTAEQATGELGMAVRPADVLLTYCAAVGLIDRDLDRGDEVTVTALARTHLVKGSPFDLRPYYTSLAERPSCRELAQVLRTGKPAAWASATAPTGVGKATEAAKTAPHWPARLNQADFSRRITAAMDARGAFLGPALAAALDGLPAQRVLDVGGSSGVYACALVDRRPGTLAAVFECVPVDAAARTLLADRGYHERIEVITGDMFTDPLPTGYDVHLYSHVLHDWDTEDVASLLSASYAALPPGGWLVDHDAHIDADKRGPLPVAEYSVLLMHSTPGKCYSIRELTEMAQQAGFIDVELRPTAADRTAVLARKPG
ncbi:MAG: acetylserotonin O-methyltransferase [Actinomycetota bacterium]|nr:acetylserotonin O-methyltransferase [Actinomycetota bacterium]